MNIPNLKPYDLPRIPTNQRAGNKVISMLLVEKRTWLLFTRKVQNFNLNQPLNIYMVELSLYSSTTSRNSLKPTLENLSEVWKYLNLKKIIAPYFFVLSHTFIQKKPNMKWHHYMCYLVLIFNNTIQNLNVNW